MLDYCSNNRRTVYNLLLEYETMKTTIIDYETRIECENDSSIFIDEFDNGLWLNIMVSGASARAILTSEQALALIDAIQFALSANKGKE
jgi:hypothetical protein